MTVQVLVLGAYVAVRDGAPVPDVAYGGRLPRRLARFLATRVDHGATQAAIADALWGADQPADPAANVAVLVNRLRGALETGRHAVRFALAYATVDEQWRLIEISVAAEPVTQRGAAAAVVIEPQLVNRELTFRSY